MITKVTDSIYYVGCNDHSIDLFEGQYVVPNGMAYNSYVILDNRTVVIDTMDQNFTDQWLANVREALGDRQPDYLLVQHMEPDHAASIGAFMNVYPETTVIGNKKTFKMIDQFFPGFKIKNSLKFDNGDSLKIGEHELNFVFAPMVHWPEVMMTYESTEKVLFSADGFGKFGALDVDEDWACEARRYYIGIVGKYGKQVQAVLQAAAGLDIQTICPLHGPVLKENLGYYINLYDIWSSYTPEDFGVCICYTSVYGNTRKAAIRLHDRLRELGVPIVVLNDLARCDMAEAVEDAFRYDTLVLATTTYNSEIFPFMNQFIDHLTERNYQNRNVAFIENGSWAPTAKKVMMKKLEGCKKLNFLENSVTITSALNNETLEDLEAMAQELAQLYKTPEIPGEADKKVDTSALFKIGYGLYVVTANDGIKDNGLICNTVTQVSDSPNRIAVNINKANYTCEIIAKTGKLNVSVLNEDAPFKLFKHFGFQSGRTVDKFADFEYAGTSSNGLKFLEKYANAYISGNVLETVDLGSHLMFICEIPECVKLNDVQTMTYNYYQANVKPKPAAQSSGWVCNVCGYIYEGENLPEDFICPLCKHGADDFSKL